MRKYEEWTESQKDEWAVRFGFSNDPKVVASIFTEIASREAPNIDSQLEEVLDRIEERLRLRKLKHFNCRCVEDEPSHEVIMSDWWEDDEGDWGSVVAYSPRKGYGVTTYNATFNSAGFVSRSWFTNRRHAPIPPEA